MLQNIHILEHEAERKNEENVEDFVRWVVGIQGSCVFLYFTPESPSSPPLSTLVRSIKLLARHEGTLGEGGFHWWGKTWRGDSMGSDKYRTLLFGSDHDTGTCIVDLEMETLNCS